jgi:DNA repair protein SbcD/Mre11
MRSVFQVVRFAHLSDCHIGGWREEKLRAISIASFGVAVEKCIEKKVDFVVIAGDLFNTSVPSIDALKQVTSGMKTLQEEGIRVYVIPGSHDYSPSGKTMLEVLERGGLCVNVFKFDREQGTLPVTVDKSGVKLVGMVGLRGQLEKFDYMKLDKSVLEKEDGLKIFLFHSLITEFKPMDFEMVDSEPLMSLPKGFHYYGGGHPHFVFSKDMRNEGYGMMTYPGPLFPNNFKELEQLKHGGFWLVDMDKSGHCTIDHVPVELKKVVSVTLDGESKQADEVTKELRQRLQEENIAGSIVTVRVTGCLAEGKVSDIPFQDVFSICDAYVVLKNTFKLTSKEFTDVHVHEGTVETVEDEILQEQMNTIPVSFFGHRDSVALAKLVMQFCDTEKLEGERVIDFEERVCGDLVKELSMDKVMNDAH